MLRHEYQVSPLVLKVGLTLMKGCVLGSQETQNFC
jgi:hypothetical protein